MESDANLSESDEGGKCDSCGKIVDILIPIRILSESKGGLEMQLRHYCPRCFQEVTDDWEPNDDGEEE